MVKAQVFAKQKIRYYALFLAAVTLFIFLSSRRITQTVSGEELAVLSCFNDIFQVGLTQHLRDSGLKPLDLALVHPHLYMLTVLWAYALFGYHDVSARLVGVFTGILTILLVFIIVQRFALGDRLRRIKIAGLVSLSYALAPTTITGALLTQIDTTVLIPLLLCVVLSATRYVVEKKRIWLVWLCLNVVFSFWARLSTPGVIVTLIAIYFLASKAEVSIKRMIILTLAGGVLAFLVLWFIYCKILGIPWFRLFGYTTSVIYRFGIVRSVVQNIQNILYVVLWLGPVTLFTIIVLFLIAGRSFLRNPKDTEPYGIFLFCGFLILISFTFIYGTHHGYPRYHSPAIPLVYIGAGLMLSREKGLFLPVRQTVLIFLLVFLAQLIIIGDPLYSIRYLLREAAVYAPTQIPIIIKTLVYRFLLFLLVCFLLWFRLVPAARLNTFIGFLVVSSLASSTGMTISQGLAPYHIGFNYGEDGMQELVQYLHRKVKKGDIIVATDDISHRLGLSSKAYLDYSIWHDTEAMRRYLQEPKVSALVISITANTIEQLRAIRQDSKLAEILQNHFEYRHIGTYRVWTKIKTVAASARQLCPRMQTLAYKNCFTQRR